MVEWKPIARKKILCKYVYKGICIHTHIHIKKENIQNKAIFANLSKETK